MKHYNEEIKYQSHNVWLALLLYYGPINAQLHVYVYNIHQRETAASRTKSATSNHVQSHAQSVLKLHVLKCICNFGSP